MVKLHSISIYAMQYDDIHELIESEDVERSRNEANWQMLCQVYAGRPRLLTMAATYKYIRL